MNVQTKELIDVDRGQVDALVVCSTAFPNLAPAGDQFAVPLIGARNPAFSMRGSTSSTK